LSFLKLSDLQFQFKLKTKVKKIKKTATFVTTKDVLRLNYKVVEDKMVKIIAFVTQFQVSAVIKLLLILPIEIAAIFPTILFVDQTIIQIGFLNRKLKPSHLKVK